MYKLHYLNMHEWKYIFQQIHECQMQTQQKETIQ